MIILYLCEKNKTLFAYGAKYALLWPPNDPHASISVHVVCNVHLKSPRKKAEGVVVLGASAEIRKKGVNMTSGTIMQKICSGL